VEKFFRASKKMPRISLRELPEPEFVPLSAETLMKAELRFIIS
jgi:hypothetical protein